MRKTAIMLLFIATIILAGCIKVEDQAGKEKATTTTTLLKAMPKTTIALPKTIVTTKETTQATSATSTTKTQPSTTLKPVSTTLPNVCASDEDCPKACNSSAYCWNKDYSWGGDEGNIYMDEIEYVCSGKGTLDARCVEVRKRINVEGCVASKCFNGLCYKTHCFNQHLDESEESIDCGGDCPDCILKENITCYNDCDCVSREGQFYTRFYRSCELNQVSASEFVVEEGKCKERDIYQKLMTHECMKPGTAKSYCTSEFTQYMNTGSCRDKNCTLDCRYKTTNYPNLALLSNRNVSFISIE